MPVEIERKFIVTSDAWKAEAPRIGTHYVHGYIAHNDEHTVRVRIAGTHGYLTIKGATSSTRYRSRTRPICSARCAAEG